MALNAILGDPLQNSYVTVEEADEYFANRAYSSKWFDFSESEKPKLLILCSQSLDWYIKWKGVRTTAEQPMQWPRTNVLLRDGTIVDPSTLPIAIKTAVYELALSFLEKGKDRTLDDDLMGLEMLKVASLTIRTKPDRSGQRTTASEAIPDKVLQILNDYRSISTFGSVRLLRG